MNEFDNFTQEDATEMIDQLVDEADAINTQLKYAKSAAFTDGEFSDADWFRKAEHALQAKRRTIQRLQLYRKQIKKKEQEEKDRMFERMFFKVVKDNVSQREYRMWLDETQERLDEHRT